MSMHYSSPFKKVLANQLEEVGLADSPQLIAPSGFILPLEPRSDTSKGGPQPMMGWLLPMTAQGCSTRV